MVRNFQDGFEIKIIDFGLSTHIEKGEKLKSFVGTPHFMAPEIFSRNCDFKCDIWSVGVLIYMMFSQGLYPFDADGETKLSKNICKGKFYLPSFERSDDPEHDDQWVPMSDEAKSFVK